MRAYDGYGEALKLMRGLVEDNIDSESALFKVGYIEELLQEISPVYNPEEDCEDERSLFWTTVYDVNMPMDERVSILMGEEI